MPLLEARQYVRICAVPESQKPKRGLVRFLRSILKPKDKSRSSIPIQHGLPGFLQSGSQLHFELIKEWIRLCDEGKCSRRDGCRAPEFDRAQMPTQVIDVGDGDTARLVLSDKDKMSQGAHYVALSHCWGKPPEKLEETTKEQKEPSKELKKNWNWSTTTSNKERRAQGFLITELPQTFQDAITVTRELGQRYLWIDSLCIIQDDHESWATESKKMKAVFQNAYCTIAATSAEDSTKGFLNRPPLKEEDSQYVMVPESSHGKVYICTSIDDFDGDVIKGVLNTRAWVLQERALSRRTIHFTKRQTYWECGGGVRCETLTYIKNAKLSFQSDPEFPRSIWYRSRSAQIELFQSLFTNYSNFGITEKTDRPVAILSLAKALADALNTKVYYGIFECFLCRSLLWQPAKNALTQIDYRAPLSKAPPSWSWMAYHGEIQYLPIKFGEVEWDDSVQLAEVKASDAATNLEDDGYVLEARVRQLRDCKIGPKGVMLDEEDKEVGQLYFDTQPEHVLSEVLCAIMGREKTIVKDGDWIYYVLFVTECATQPGRGKFNRVGVGSIQKRFILFDGQDKTAQIL